MYLQIYKSKITRLLGSITSFYFILPSMVYRNDKNYRLADFQRENIYIRILFPDKPEIKKVVHLSSTFFFSIVA